MVAPWPNARIRRKSGFRSADAPDVNPPDHHEHWLVHRTDTGEQRHRLAAPGTVRIGRSVGSDVLLAHPAVSREHAVLEWTADSRAGGAWRITDRGSASGTRVNGVAMQAHRSLVLEPGDRVSIGPLEFDYLRRVTADAPTVIARIDAPQREHIEPVQPAALEAAHLDAVVAAGVAIHAAQDERAVADAAVDAIARASGFADVAFVGPHLTSDGQFHVVSGRGSATAAPRLSRSVLARARLGAVIVSDAGGVADSHRTLADLRVSRVVCVPVELGTRFHGLIYLADGGAFRTPLEPVAALVRSVAAVAALAIANIERLRTTARLEAEHRAMFDGTMQALIATIDAKDPYTRGHSARVAEFAHLLAVNAGLTAADAERARLCGLVHDIGKIGVSEEVLRKPGKLTDEEFLQIAAHPVIGHDILRGIPQMADVLPGVLCHHEKWAGGGYPHRIAGEEIPLLGRIIAIADAIDAMTTSRTYRGARPMTDAIAEITRCAGTHFDPRLAAVAASIDRRALQGIVGLHVFGPTPAASPAAAQMTCGAPAPCTDTAGTTDTKLLLDARQDDRTRRTA